MKNIGDSGLSKLIQIIKQKVTALETKTSFIKSNGVTKSFTVYNSDSYNNHMTILQKDDENIKDKSNLKYNGYLPSRTVREVDIGTEEYKKLYRDTGKTNAMKLAMEHIGSGISIGTDQEGAMLIMRSHDEDTYIQADVLNRSFRMYIVSKELNDPEKGNSGCQLGSAQIGLDLQGHFYITGLNPYFSCPNFDSRDVGFKTRINNGKPQWSPWGKEEWKDL